MKLLNKEIKFFSTSGLTHDIGEDKIINLIKLVFPILEKHPVDMLVLKKPDVNTFQIKSSGYFFNEEQQLDEKTILLSVQLTEDSFFNSLPTIWLKIDDYGEEYIATFLKPSEY